MFQIWIKAIRADATFRRKLYTMIRDFTENVPSLEIRAIQEGYLKCVEEIKQVHQFGIVDLS